MPDDVALLTADDAARPWNSIHTEDSTVPPSVNQKIALREVSGFMYLLDSDAYAPQDTTKLAAMVVIRMNAPVSVPP